jgi:NAD(P)-dependent dehydrogenase (short-subunit alcohol dehydrogenase family)
MPTEILTEKNIAIEVAVVTGVGRREGIGFEICRQLAARKITVFLTARNPDSAASLAKLLVLDGLDVRPFALDVSQPESIANIAKEVQSTFGKLDILVNNAAGVAPFGERAESADLEVAHSVIETTLFGSWRLSQSLLPLLRKSANGRIVNVTSGAGSHGDTAFGLTTDSVMGTSYAVAKAALNALTAKMAHEEQAASDVRVNAVCPGFTATFPGGEAMGARPVVDGATSVTWAALLGPDGPTGGFFRDGKPLPW